MKHCREKLHWQGRRDREERSDGIVSECACTQFANVTRKVDAKQTRVAWRIALVANKKALSKDKALAGETRFEHATSGFGDRCSTVEPLPYEIIDIIK